MRQFSVPPGTTIIARDGLAARQWEAFLARAAGLAGARAWRTPSLIGYRAWRAELWNEQENARPLLTPAQSGALWRRVVAASPASAELIDAAAPAAWAADAWGLLAKWRIDHRTLAATREQPDFLALLRWCAEYAQALAANDWQDAAMVEGALTRLPAVERLVRAGLDERDVAPTERALFERLAAAGTLVECWSAPTAASRQACRVRAADEREELEAAVEWATEQARLSPERRVALVIADLDTRRAELERLLAAAMPEPARVWDPHGGGSSRDASIGAALTGIELLSPGAPFASLSRWLRSLPLTDAHASDWARLEATLRGELLSQLGFRDAFRRAGLRARLQTAAPDLARALDAALQEAGEGGRRTPSGWAAAWQRGLRALGWPLAPLAAETRNAWESALAELRRLTPVLGPIAEAEARGELARIVGGLSAPAPLPIGGVAVLARPEDVGPGYDAAWLSGFTNTYWPRPARLNPLLPRRLQQAHDMPWCTPHDALERSTRVLQTLLAHVPELIVSWPEQARDQPAEPSPMILPLPEREPWRPRRAESFDSEPERLEDRPPPWSGRSLPGGAAALNAQARAPLRAFCDYRLRTRALEPFALGLSPRLRGIATHRALELLCRAAPSGDRARQRHEACAAALGEAFGAARPGLEALFRLEHQRLTELLEAFDDAERARASFTIEAVERREAVTVGPFDLRVRIDRVDRLADGRLAVLDYKTGPASAGDWFRERLRDAQVPLYAVHLGAGVAAAALVTLDAAGIAYQGIWAPGVFPGRPRALQAESWPAQLQAWRAQLEALAAELAAGDCRVFLGELDLVRGAYAPLTRIHEQLKLHRAGEEL